MNAVPGSFADCDGWRLTRVLPAFRELSRQDAEAVTCLFRPMCALERIVLYEELGVPFFKHGIFRHARMAFPVARDANGEPMFPKHIIVMAPNQPQFIGFDFGPFAVETYELKMFFVADRATNKTSAIGFWYACKL